jgi:hypothetical protein
MREFMKSRFYLGLLIAFLLPGMAQAQFELFALSDDPGPNLRIVLIWPDAPGVAGYNLYRKTSLVDSYPAIPLNAAPIRAMTSCIDIQAILVPGSQEWVMIEQGLADTTALFDPCDISGIVPGTHKHNLLMLLCRGREKIARVAGQGYSDGNVINGQTYFYRIVGVSSDGTVTDILDDDVSVTAGVVTILPPPEGIVAEAGDNEVLIRWDDVSQAAGYTVLRSIAPGGPFIPVSMGGFTLKVNVQLSGDTLVPSTNGFLDFRRFDTNGIPTYHEVNGNMIYGPENGKTYYYKLQSIDLIGRTGPLSPGVVFATPQDSTPPATPGDISVFADEPASSLIITWTRVKSDINGNLESPPINRYMLYRLEHADDDPSATGVLVDGNIIPPANPQILTVSYTDNSPGLRSAYGEKTWWYRVVAVDSNGNRSQYSMASGGALKDISPPNLVKNLKTEGLETHISLTWEPNTEPDIDGYMIYRSLCHLNEWIPCRERDRDPDEKPRHEEEPTVLKQIEQVCSGPFVYLGMVYQDSVVSAVSSGSWIYEDRTIPSGSPLCYAYWVKAVDKSGNRSGGWPMPIDPDETDGIACDRLRDRTPPEPALIAGIYARDKAILIEWIGPPTQDTRAYHVYRAPGKAPHVEPDGGDFHWVGGMTVEPPPGSPIALTTPYVPVQPADCGVIPVQASEYMSHGSYLDKKVDAKEVYWYKVVGIDYDGNEGYLDEAISVSTFTFSSELAETPGISTISTLADTCALVITWIPVFDAGQHLGFAIFKSRNKWSGYNQIANLLQENTYIDTQVVRGVEYWYRIALLNAEGTVSQLTVPVNGKVGQ